jgi:N6-adenosine-specific RNA methylase IME4
MPQSKTNPGAADAGAPQGISIARNDPANTEIAAEAQVPLVRYETACRALAEAKSVDEVKEIRDEAVAIAAYARQAKNRSLEADAVEIRMRATRRLDQLRQAQKETVGLATGGEHGGRRRRIDGVRNTPSIMRPTLSMQGVDKNLAKQARAPGALSDENFEIVVADARDKVNRAVRNAMREVEILHEHQSYAARTGEGCTVDDLHALAASGFRAATIYTDVPSRFEVYSGKGKQRAADRYYDTMDVPTLKAMGPVVQALVAKDCVLQFWTTGPQNKAALEIVEAWGFTFKTWGFVWIKTNPSSGAPELEQLTQENLHWGMGYTTRANAEVVLLATRGSPRRLAADVHQVVLAPHPAPGRHSEKPEEVRRRIERLYPGPYLELFGRKPVPGWTVWGNEIKRESFNGDETPPDSAEMPPAFLRRPEAAS